MPSPQPTSATPPSMMSKLQNKLLSTTSMSGKRRSIPTPLCFDAQPLEAENSIGSQSMQVKIAEESAPSIAASTPSLLLPLALKVASTGDSKYRRFSAPPSDALPSPPVCERPTKLRSPIGPSLSLRSQALMRRSKDLLLRRFSAQNKLPCPSQHMDQTDTTVPPPAPPIDLRAVAHSEPRSLYTSFLDLEEDSEWSEEEDSRPSLTLSDIEAALESPPTICSSSDACLALCTPQNQRSIPVTNARVSYSSTSTYDSTPTTLFSASVPPTPTTASTTFTSHPYRRVTHSDHHTALADSSLALYTALNRLHDLRPKNAYRNQHLLTAEVKEWELRIRKNKSTTQGERLRKMSPSTSPII